MSIFSARTAPFFQFRLPSFDYSFIPSLFSVLYNLLFTNVLCSILWRKSNRRSMVLIRVYFGGPQFFGVLCPPTYPFLFIFINKFSKIFEIWSFMFGHFSKNFPKFPENFLKFSQLFQNRKNPLFLHPK